jgi:multidrug efflux system membrane fusion protein
VKRIVFVIAAVVLGAVALVVHLRRAHPSMAAELAPAIPVTVGHAKQEDMPIWLAGVGAVQPLNVVNVKVRVDGQLERVTFTEGTEVKSGAVLAQIDPRPFEAQLQSARATLAKDEASLANAKTNVTRFEKLTSIGAAPAQNLDTFRAQVAELEAATQGDRAMIDTARLNLGFTTVRAPFDGRVGLRLVDPGSIVHASDPNGLVTVTQMDPIAVLFSISQDDLPAVRAAGAKVTVAAYTHDGTRSLGQGELGAIDSQIDATSGQVRLKALFSNAQRALWPGEFVTVRVLLRTDQNSIVVPAQAVLQGQQGSYVYAVKPDTTVEAHPIQAGATVDGKTQVRSGLAANDAVVVAGQARLAAGARVTAKEVAQ